MIRFSSLISFFLFLGTLVSGWGQSVVINEIHYDPEPDNEPVEYIELYNAGETTADLSGWYFSSGISYLFAEGSSLEPGEFLILAENVKEYDRKFGSIFVGGIKGFDQWSSGGLSNGGDDLVLRNADREIMDRVDYGVGFPWPTGSRGGDAELEEPEGLSMELLHPSLDNDLGGSWRVAEKNSPGKINSVHTEPTAVPPHIRQVNHAPRAPGTGEAVTVTARVTDDDGVASVLLHYQQVKPGSYIDLEDEAYQTDWTDLPMNDAGEGGDEIAGDGVYTVVLPGDLQTHRYLMRYRITIEDAVGNSLRVPYPDDGQPNFAYFVFDGVIPWEGAANPGTTEKVTYSSELLESVPVYQLITKKQSHLDSQSIPGARGSSYGGSDYPWFGTLVYNGDVYDHVQYRARGGVWRYAMGKNMWKFRFHAAHDFEPEDNYGEKYNSKWRRLNFSAIIQQGNFQHRGEQGLFESVGFDLFRMAGVEGPRTHYVHFRIIENSNETSIFGNQYGTDFQGLYLAIEQMDGRLLESQGLPDGNVYKMENGTGPRV
ncbi:MAG: lamin tail domain-containing protein, partial [Verrucomicrobiota bacterium]